MAITAYTGKRIGSLTMVNVVSSLTGLVYYHWYLDGTWTAMTTTPSATFNLEIGEQARIEVVDTNDPAFDPLTAGPALFPARRTLWWTRSLAADVAKYRVEQISSGGGGWTVIGEVWHEERRWDYTFVTPRLADLTIYWWRVIPVDAAGNDGSLFALVDTAQVVRPPDAPKFSVAYGPGWARTIAAA